MPLVYEPNLRCNQLVDGEVVRLECGRENPEEVSRRYGWPSQALVDCG